MKKLQFATIILVIIVMFGAADFYLNNLKSQLKLPKIPSQFSSVQQTTLQIGFADSVFKLNQIVEGYKVNDQTKTSSIFEKVNIAEVKNTYIYLNKLSKQIAEQKVKTGEDQGEGVSNIYIYEIHGPSGQGSLTYLSVKLQFITQIGSVAGSLNETGSYGQNSFFYNNPEYDNIAFLVTQVKDNLYAFQYDKKDPNVFESVKNIINQLNN